MTVAELRYYREVCSFSYRDIEELTGVPRTTIASRCQKLGLHPKIPIVARDCWRKRMKPVKYSNINPKLIEYLYWDLENSAMEVAKILRIPNRSLLSLMIYHKIPRRSASEAQTLSMAKRKINGRK